MKPHDLITALVRAINARDRDSLAGLFSPQSSVRDGGLSYSGPVAIKLWIRDCIDRYSLNLKIVGVSEKGGYWLFDALVSGTFEGSPVRIEHQVTVQDGKIAKLDI